MDRRNWIKQSSLLATALIASLDLKADEKSTILLCSGWQYANIGDIAHTPGLLNLLKIHVPNAEVILWPNHESREIDQMLLKHFPNLKIISGKLNDGEVDSEEVLKSIDQADFLLHGSGPGVIAASKINFWRKRSKKPYGIYGVTISYVNDLLHDIISNSDFIFTRETSSLDVLQQHKIDIPIKSFAPDATFAMDLHDDRKAFKFLTEHKLEYKKFICAIPRLRKTPYYKIYDHFNWSEERIREVEQLNEQYKEKDHAKLRKAMIEWVRQTGNKVLICPEMTYQLDIMDELLIDPLPVDVKKKVVKKDSYWMPTEAGSVYNQALAVLSFECHSPIISAVNGTPCFYLRQPEDTIKGQMWYDIGLNNWVFEIEETFGEDIAQELLKVYDNYEQAKKYLADAMDTARLKQRNSFIKIRDKWKTSI